MLLDVSWKTSGFEAGPELTTWTAPYCPVVWESAVPGTAKSPTVTINANKLRITTPFALVNAGYTAINHCGVKPL